MDEFQYESKREVVRTCEGTQMPLHEIRPQHPGPDPITEKITSYWADAKSRYRRTLRFPRTFSLPVLPTSGDTLRLLEKIESDATSVLKAARIKWPTSKPLKGLLYHADQALRNIHGARHYMERGDLDLAIYFAIHAGQSAARVASWPEHLLAQSASKLSRGGEESGRQRRASAQRPRVLKRYAELVHNHEKSEAAKRQCCTEFKKLSRATISRWLQEDREEQALAIDFIFLCITSFGDSEEHAIRLYAKARNMPRREVQGWWRERHQQSGLAKGS